MIGTSPQSVESALSIKDLTIAFGPNSTNRVVDRVSLEVHRGEIMGLIGESGSGKTLTALSVLGLIPIGAKILSGAIEFGGANLLAIRKSELRHIRGNRISMIFQDPGTSMNPVLRVGNQVSEPLVTHRRQGWRASKRSAIDLLRRVHIPHPEEMADAYPYQYSGGMLQRATIAMGLACQPELIIADEPTTALDVTIQAQILQLMREIRKALGTAILLITHDMGIVAEVCDRVAVMYSGRIMETGSVAEVFSRPRHPYTQALLAATPRIDADFDLESLPRLPPQKSSHAGNPCRFLDRCPHRFADCLREPELSSLPGGGSARCWLVVQTP